MFTRSLMVMLLSVMLLAAFSMPAFSKTYRWQPSSWIPSGISWDSIGYVCDYVTKMSNKRIIMKPSAPGAIVPVSEQAFAHGDCLAVPKNIAEMRYLYEQYEGGRIMEILREEYAKHGVYLVGNVYWVLENIMISKKPIKGVKDIKGTKFRSSELIALQLAELGAGTIWTPADEIYTMLSTGGVDAITFSHAADMVDMGFHEVTKYWIKYPTAVGPAADGFIVNLKTWKSLPDDLKAILEAACVMASARNKFEADMAIDKAWHFVQDKGIEIIEWPEEDAKILASTAAKVVPEKYMKDKAFKEIYDITKKWAIEQGYWENK